MSGRAPSKQYKPGQSQIPLLKDERGRPSSYDAPDRVTQPEFAVRRSTFRSRSPADQKGASATKTKYGYAAVFLILSLISFTVQTETAVHIQRELGWNKAYCMLWVHDPFRSRDGWGWKEKKNMDWQISSTSLKVSNSWLMVIAMAVNVSFFTDKELEETVAGFLEASCLHSK